MSNSKKTIYYDGIRIFQKKENQPCWSGVISPNQLFGFLKSGQADGGKSEYNGETQFKFSLWVNEDGSASMSVNDYQPSQESVKSLDSEDGLPF
jgi:hypothetical protein|tara:strand:- start:5966 stop:6247 length:282 start_codon:yes stop_codon:yes gene_type:complete